MILYHGTNADIESIDLTKGLRFKDFGNGFYLTPNRETACRMAQKRARLFGGTATLITYELDDSALQSDLKVRVFPEKAPIADDGVVLQLTNYREGIYSPEEAARLLQDRYLDQQYYFGTERALNYLHKINVETI